MGSGLGGSTPYGTAGQIMSKLMTDYCGVSLNFQGTKVPEGEVVDPKSHKIALRKAFPCVMRVIMSKCCFISLEF